VPLTWVSVVRVVLMIGGSGFSAWLGWKLLRGELAIRRLLAFAVYLMPIAVIDLIWSRLAFA
jgi:hypothetical protein